MFVGRSVLAGNTNTAGGRNEPKVLQLTSRTPGALVSAHQPIGSVYQVLCLSSLSLSLAHYLLI